MRMLRAALAAFFVAGIAMSAQAGETIVSQPSTAAEGSHVFCARSCFLRSLYMTTGAAAGFLMTFNATSAPADGAVTPVECLPVAANSFVALDYGDTQDAYNVG